MGTENKQPGATQPPPPGPSGGKPPDSLEAYNTVAETVGLVPSLRKRDNQIQGLAVLGGAVLGALIGLVLGKGLGALIGALAGLVVAAFLSGLVLMVLGWVRLRKRRGGRPG